MQQNMKMVRGDGRDGGAPVSGGARARRQADRSVRRRVGKMAGRRSSERRRLVKGGQRRR
jgi:hypothetical protein